MLCIKSDARFLPETGELKYLNAYVGKHGEDKPTDSLLEGSVVYEMDTGDWYMYDGEEWLKQ